MDSKKFEILMTAVNLGSFSKASEVVGYTQSGLTHLINGLEREIGMKLIRRDHSGISLTEDGEALLPAIREYLSATAKLENQIETITQKRTATIRIAAYASLAMHWMPEILYRFRRVCPETDVDLRMVDHELEPFELLEEGRTDVIFAARQSHINCDWTPLYYDAMYAILPEDYPTGSEETFPIEEFDGKEFLMPYGRFDIDVNAALSPKKVKPNIRPCHVDDETVIRMVSKGLGITMMTEIMMRGRTHGVKTLPVSPKTGRELGIGMHLSKNTRCLMTAPCMAAGLHRSGWRLCRSRMCMPLSISLLSVRWSNMRLPAAYPNIWSFSTIRKDCWNRWSLRFSRRTVFCMKNQTFC